jgi:hypothetical protein
MLNGNWNNIQKPQAGCPLLTGHPLVKSLVACFPFNENGGGRPVDYSQGCNVMTLRNGVSRTIGNYGKALYFDGTDDYGDITYKDIWRGSSDDSLTFISAVRRRNNTQSHTLISKMYSANNQITYTIYFTTAGAITFQTTNATSAEVFQESGTSLSTLNVWYSVAFKYTFGTGSTAKFFVNCLPVSASWTTGDGDFYLSDVTTFNPRLGEMEYDSYPNRLQGDIAFLYVFRRLLPDNDIISLCRNPYSIFAPSASNKLFNVGAAPPAIVPRRLLLGVGA